VVAPQILVELIQVAVLPLVDVAPDELFDRAVASAGEELQMYQKDCCRFAVAEVIGYLVLVHLVASEVEMKVLVAVLVVVR
jgi:hypothetical protein